MGKRSGTTKSGRVMNPADRERKQMRLKELKRNKKQRVMVRNAIVKSRNPEDLIEQMRRMDDQEFDQNRELSLNVIMEKRSKMRGAFIQIIALYRQEKDDKKVKSLERMLHEYEIDRFKKEQNFRARQFSENADPDDIPLPCGIMDPDAAKTPFSAIPIPPIVPPLPSIKSGILKKAQIGPTIPLRKQLYPPGPPCGLPPRLVDSEEETEIEEAPIDRRSRSRRVRFNEEPDEKQNDDNEDDYAPVEIPEAMTESAPPQHEQPPRLPHSYSRYGPPPTLMPPGSSGPPRMFPPGIHHPMHPPPRHQMQPGFYPSNFPMHQNIPPEIHAQMLRTGRLPPGFNRSPEKNIPSNSTGLIDEPHPSAVISAEPQVVKPTVDKVSSTENVISAGPQMRNLKKETTRFVPSSLKVHRPSPSAIGPKIPVGASTQVITHKKRPAPSSKGPYKSVDDACDEFMKELAGLL